MDKEGRQGSEGSKDKTKKVEKQGNVTDIKRGKGRKKSMRKVAKENKMMKSRLWRQRWRGNNEMRKMELMRMCKWKWERENVNVDKEVDDDEDEGEGEGSPLE